MTEPRSAACKHGYKVREDDPSVQACIDREAFAESRSRPVEGTANPQRPDIPVETYVSHALTGAAFTARIFWEQPVLTPEDAKKFGQWAEAEFLRIAHKEVGERDLIG